MTDAPSIERAAIEDEVTRGGIARAIDRARALRAGDRETAAWFFERFSDLSRDSVDFAVEHALFLHDVGAHTRALAVIADVPMASTSERIALLAADAETALGRPGDAIARLDRLIRKTRTSSLDVWTRFLCAVMATGELDRVLAAFARWQSENPRRLLRGAELVADWLDARGDARVAEYRDLAGWLRSKGT